MKTYLLPFILLLANQMPAFSQPTIFEVLGLMPDGCPLQAGNTRQQQREEAIADISTTSAKPISVPSNKQEVYQVLAARVQEQAYLYPDLFQARIAYDARRRFVRIGDLWGLQQLPTDLVEAKMLLKPQYDHVVADTINQGFIAYRAGKANFYDLSGKPQFANEYYDIQPTLHGHFKVSTAEGIGLIDASGEFIIKAVNKGIGVWGTSVPYYYVRVKDGSSYVLSATSFEPIYYNANQYNWNFINSDYAIINDNTLIDLKKKREVFCGKSLNVHLLDVDKGLVHLSLAEQPTRRYIAYFDGQLLSTEPYYEVGYYYPEGYVQVALPNTYQPGRRASLSYGLIDSLGKWALAAEHKHLGTQLIAKKYVQAINERQESTLLDQQGTALFPYQAQARFRFSADEQQLEMRYQKDGAFYLSRYDLAKQQLLPATPIDYLSTRPFKICENGNYQIADTKEGELLLAPDGQAALPKAYKRLFYGPTPNTLIAMEAAAPGSNRYMARRQFYTCAGELQTFDIEGETIDQFYNFYNFGEGLSFLRKDEHIGHFILGSGETTPTDYGWFRKLGRVGTDHVLSTGTNDCGLVSDRGELLLPPSFSSIFFRPSAGLVMVRRGDRGTQWIQPDGRLLFDGQYEQVEFDEFGVFRVRVGDQWGMAQRNGTLLLPLVFQSIRRINGIYIATRTNGMKEHYDYLGQLIN